MQPTMGVKQSKVDSCVFYVKRDRTLILIIGSHVDGGAIAGKPVDVLSFKTEIKGHFTIKESGRLHKHFRVWYN
jgi:hypothetical protein